MTELIEASASFAEQPGLRDHATVAGVGSARPGQGRQEAGALARPSLRPRTLRYERRRRTGPTRSGERNDCRLLRSWGRRRLPSVRN